jgi:hypothetical protein
MVTHIKNILKDFLKDNKKDIEDKEKMERILYGALDKKLKGHIKVKRIYKNKVVLSSDSAAFSYEFNLKKKSVLEKLKKTFSQIEDIKIKVG